MRAADLLKLFTFGSFCFWYVKMLVFEKQKDAGGMIEAAANAIIHLIIFFAMVYSE